MILQGSSHLFLLEDTKEFKIMYKKFKVALTS